MNPWNSRRRRRRGLWVAVALTAGVLVVLGMGQVQSETRILAAYLDEATAVSSRQATLAASFQNLVIGLDRSERPALVASLADMEESAEEGVAALARAELPAMAAEANGFLVVALSSWHSGLGAFGEALLGVVDDPEDPRAVEELRQALVDLRIGDRAYGRFRTVAVRLEQALDVPGNGLPAVRFLPREDPSGVFSAEGIAQRARAAQNLVIRRDVGVAAVRFEPDAAGQRDDGVPVLPYSASLDLQVSIVNKGNQEESQVRVRIRLGEGLEEEAVVESLAPGASKTLTFQDLPAPPGQESLLVVEVLPVEGEAEEALADNVSELRFYRNPEE